MLPVPDVFVSEGLGVALALTGKTMRVGPDTLVPALGLAI